MLEKTNITEKQIADCLSARYGITAAEIAFLPIGYDASAWAYRVAAADGQCYFLKQRRGAIHTAPAAITRYLQAEGIRHVVAPLHCRRLQGNLWHHLRATRCCSIPGLRAEVVWTLV